MNHKHRRVHAFLTFQYDCFGAPLEFNGVKYSWWNDRYGKVQYFWSGTNTNSHICQCGIDKDCVDPDVKCNCDSYELQQLNDSGLWVLLSNIFRFKMNVLSAGYITAKDVLPVSKVNFGRTHSKHSSGRFTLGEFECSGTQLFQGMPSSCQDLKRIGHCLSGFYTVKVGGKLKKLYCDMSKRLGDKGNSIFELLTLKVFFFISDLSTF